MRVFAIGIEYALDAAVERPQHADTRVQQRSPIFRSHDKRLDRGLPVGGFVLGWRKARDVVSGIPQRDERAAVGEDDRILEAARPGHAAMWAA